MSNSTSAKIGFAGGIALVFITLKLTGDLDWPWWGVLAPFWLPVVVVVGMIAGAAVGGLLARGVRRVVRR